MRKPKTKDQTEAWVKKQVKQILEDTGWKFWMPSAGLFGRSGVSDFLCVKRPGLFMAIETKYDDVVTTQQHKFLTDVRDARHYAFVVDETNIEELRAVLKRQHYHGYVHLKGCDNLVKWQTQNVAEKLDAELTN
jgi:hypothetical protein